MVHIRIFSMPFCLTASDSTDFYGIYFENLPYLPDFVCKMSYSYGAVMCGAIHRPSIHKFLCTYAEPVTAVRISNLQYRSRNRFPLRNQKENSFPALHYGQYCHWTMLHCHLD